MLTAAEQTKKDARKVGLVLPSCVAAQAIADANKKLKWAHGLQPNLDALRASQNNSEKLKARQYV